MNNEIKINEQEEEKKQKSESVLVVEENTIYEIDLECYRKMHMDTGK